MDGLILARVIHVLAVVHWIGGVAMVTLVLLPQIRAMPEAGPAADEGIATFALLEGRFGAQAKVSTLFAGLSGFWMVHAGDGWWMFADPAYWWVHLMLAVWTLFTLVLFVLEPLVLHRWFAAAGARDPAGTLKRVLGLHRVLLALSLLAVAGAVAGAHGGI